MSPRARTRWEFLTDGQRAIATDLVHRAERLMLDSPSLALAEAIDIAAIQRGYVTSNPNLSAFGNPNQHEVRTI